ncbi:conserved protein of unknown function [Serratia sp. Tan611]|nr:conserved protein of unknown function [Serratia sp. Tan611]
MQEVDGSIPSSSTNLYLRKVGEDTVTPVNADHICGAIAQLGERLHGMQEVSGSIPLSSTII